MLFSLWSIIQSLHFRKPPGLMPSETIPRLVPFSSSDGLYDKEVIHVSDVFKELSDGYVGSEVDRTAQLQGCRIGELYLCKGTDFFQHEYIVAAVRDELQVDKDNDNSNVYYLRLERDSGSNLSDPVRLAKAGAVKQSKVGANPAFDTLRCYSHANRAIAFSPPKSPVFTCWTITFPDDHRPNLIELVSAAYTLNKLAPNYTVTRFMCYWFSHNLLRLLTYQRQHTIIISPSAPYVVPGCLLGIAALTTVSQIRDDLDIKDGDDTVAKLKEALLEADRRRRVETGSPPEENNITVGSPGQFLQPDTIIGYYNSYQESVAVAMRQISEKENALVAERKKKEEAEKNAEAERKKKEAAEKDAEAARRDAEAARRDAEAERKEKEEAQRQMKALQEEMKALREEMKALREQTNSLIN